MDKDIVLKAEHLKKCYGERTIIEDINLKLGRGELVSLLGVSGVGKSTLFQVLSGLKKPEEGRVWLRDEEITGVPGKISYMLQKDLLLKHKKIIDNVSLPLVLKGMKKQDARTEAGKLFDQFGLEGTQLQYPGELSGGMRQRAALLRTYLASDGVALLDEPFSALDTLTKASVHNWYLKVMEEIELSTIFITHDIEEAILLSDRIYILSGQPGRIQEEIVIREPKPRPQNFDLTEAFLSYKKEIVEKLL